MDRGSVFLTNKTQAVRFPKSVRLPEGIKSVEIERRGRSWLVTPLGHGWAAWFDETDVSSDFMADRDQPAEQEREQL